VALSNSSGNICCSYQYSAYGQVAASDPDFTANPCLFTGRRFDYETGLYYYRARYYNPYIGRFLQTDPVGYGDGINWYVYCGNNPLSFVDPLGLRADPENIYAYFYDPRSAGLFKLFGKAWTWIELMAFFNFDELEDIKYLAEYGEVARVHFRYHLNRGRLPI
jgi:RHS repeat-associated protein